MEKKVAQTISNCNACFKCAQSVILYQLEYTRQYYDVFLDMATVDGFNLSFLK